MASYFRQVPNFKYVSRNKGQQQISQYIPVKNLFKRGKLREDIFGNLNFFEKYSIIGDERPDNVAAKFYEDSTLDWVVLLSNNILNIQSEWPMTQRTFDNVMLEKYGTYENLYSNIHHYETEEIKNSLGITVLKGGIKMNPTWKTNGNFIETINSTIASISATQNANQLTSSNIVTVFMENEIPNILPGSQVMIDGVSENEYNGKHIVQEIYRSGFTYIIDQVPSNINPKLSTSRREQVIFSLPSNFINQSGDSAYYYEYWDDGLGYTVVVPVTSFIKAVTNYEYERTIEEKKRNIFILKPKYLNVVFNDMEDIMPYKKGGVQYVNPTMKKGDNIRLYE